MTRIILLFIVGIAFAFQYSKFPLISPELSEHYGYSLVESNVLISSVSFIGILFGVLFALWIRKIGATRSLIFSLFLAIATSSMMAVCSSFYLFLLLRILEGASNIVAMISIPMLIYTYGGNHRNIVMALWGAVFGIAFSTSSILVPEILRLFTWQAAFYFHSGLFIVLTIAVSWLFRSCEDSSAKKTTETLVNNARNLMSEIFSNKRFIASLLIFLPFTMLYISTISMMTSYAYTVYDGDFKAVSELVFTCTLIGTISVIASSFIFASVNRAIVMITVSFLCIGINAMDLFEQANFSQSKFIFHFILLGVIESGVFSLIAHFSKDEGEVLALKTGYIHVGNTGAFLGPILAALIVSNFGWEKLGAGIATISTFGVVFGAYAFILTQKRRNVGEVL